MQSNVFGPKRKWQNNGNKCTISSFVICTAQKITVISSIKSRRMRCAGYGAGMGKETMHARLWW
jgi:hypothetical protein